MGQKTVPYECSIFKARERKDSFILIMNVGVIYFRNSTFSCPCVRDNSGNTVFPEICATPLTSKKWINQCCNEICLQNQKPNTRIGFQSFVLIFCFFFFTHIVYIWPLGLKIIELWISRNQSKLRCNLSYSTTSGMKVHGETSIEKQDK